MKLIIDIQSDFYKNIGRIKNGSIASQNILNAVKVATPLEAQRNLTNEELYQSFIKLEAENERLHDVLESQRWIPVSEKLPEEQTHVIVTIGNERFTSTQLCLYTSTSIFWKEYVKAWMPLPQAYKAESEDEE